MYYFFQDKLIYKRKANAMKKFLDSLRFIVMSALIGIGFYWFTSFPPPHYVSGYIPQSAKPTVTWIKYRGEWYTRTTVPMVIENGNRGMVLNATIPGLLYVSDETINLCESRESYPPAIGKKVLAVAEIDKETGSLLIKEASLKPVKIPEPDFPL